MQHGPSSDPELAEGQGESRTVWRERGGGEGLTGQPGGVRRDWWGLVRENRPFWLGMVWFGPDLWIALLLWQSWCSRTRDALVCAGGETRVDLLEGVGGQGESEFPVCLGLLMTGSTFSLNASSTAVWFVWWPRE